MYRTWTCLFLALIAAVKFPLYAQDDDFDSYGPQPQKEEAARQRHVENVKRYADNQDVLVLPGLVAKRQEQRVEILTESTGVSTHDAAEFMVVHTKSSHGYEALLWSYAKPSDIHEALEFIGLAPGGSRDPSQLRFRGKGEKVLASVQGEDVSETVPLETLIIDRHEEEPLPERGFIFTGSMMTTAPDNSGTRVYAADQYEPYPVISGFNDRLAVLDVAWDMSKPEAYNSYAINPDYPLEGHTIYTLVLEPESKDGGTSIRNLTLRIEDDETFILKDNESGKQLTPETTISAALEVCRDMVQNGLNPYLTLRFSNDMTLREIQPVCRGLAMLDQPGVLSIEPPLSGRLYYRSFLPNPEWREPAERTSQAWEIHIARENGKMTSDMVFHETIWEDGDTKPDFKRKTFPAPSAQAIRERLDTDAEQRKSQNKRQAPPVLMVYAPADLEYGQLLDFLSPALKTHNTVHLFLKP